MAMVNPIELVHNDYEVSVATGKELVALELTKIFFSHLNCKISRFDVAEVYKDILAELQDENKEVKNGSNNN